MGRITWVCATCSQDFTRRTYATRHNNNTHYGQGEIVPLLEYMVGRGTGRYMASNRLLYRRRQKWQIPLAHNPNIEFGPATVADSAGDRFRPGKGPQEAPRGNMYKPSYYFTTPTLGPVHVDDQRCRTFKSQDIGLKIEELKIPTNKHRSYLEDANGRTSESKRFN